MPQVGEKKFHVDCIEADEEFRHLLAQDGFDVFAAPGLLTEKYSRIYSINVIEHIEDDVAILQDLRNQLDREGKILIYLPIFQLLYTFFDKKSEHFGRYRRNELVDKLRRSGFTVERVEYVDSIGFFCWLVMKYMFIRGAEVKLNEKHVVLFDRCLFPITRLCGRIMKCFFGKNLLVIATRNH